MPIKTQAEWQREQNRQDVHYQRSLDIRAAEAQHIEARTEQRRRMRQLQIEHQEIETEDTLKKVEEYRCFRAQQLEQDARFAEAMLRTKNDKLADEKRRQQIRESSDELKQLEAKLRAAYALKELDLQITEKRLMEIRAKKDEELEKEMQSELWEQQEKENEQREHEVALSKQQYGSELRQQVISGENKKQMLFEEFLRDKQIIDAAVRRIHEEDEKAELEQMDKVQRTKQEIEDFKKAQAVWREKHIQEMEKENQHIEAYLQKQETDNQENEIRNKELEKHKSRQNEKLAAQIFAIQKEKHEKEKLMEMLAEEECIAALEHRYQKELQKRLKDRDLLREVYQRQFTEKKERLQREACEEKEKRQQMLDKMAEDAHVDQLTREKQRLKMIQLRSEVEAVLEAKRVQRKEELQELQKLEEMAREEEQKRCDLIEDERLRMLKEHAKNMFGYIPHGVLRESDLPILGPEFVEKYGSKGAVLKKKADVSA